MDPKFVKEVQQRGWHVEAVTDEDVIGRCPSIGCGLRAKLNQNARIPDVDPGCRRSRIDKPVHNFEDVRKAMRQRREELALTIHEVEEIGGITVDYLAKFEKENPSKIPNASLLFEWVQTLGYELVLRPIEMTPYAIRTICETRDKLASRQKRFSNDKRRRDGVGQQRR